MGNIVVRLKSDNYDCYVSAAAYQEIRLQMSTGVHATHRARFFEASPDQLENIKYHSSTRDAKGIEKRRLGFVDLCTETENLGVAVYWYFYDGHGDCYIDQD